MIVGTRTAVAVAAALAVSLVVNFVGAGYLVGTFSHRPPPPPPPGFGFLMRAFPPEIRDAVRADDQNRPLVRQAARELNEARQQTFEAMRADPLDPARVKALFLVEQDKARGLMTIVQSSILRALETVPLAVRQEIGRGKNAMPPVPLDDGPPPPPPPPPPGNAP